MRLLDILNSKDRETLINKKGSLRSGKAGELFGKLRKRIKRDNLIIVSDGKRIRKVFYGGEWRRPVIINDKLYLLSKNESIEYVK